MKYANTLIDVLIAVVVFGALFPIINTAIGGIGLDNITVGATTYDFSWVGYLLVLGLLFGLVYLAMDQFKKK